RTSSILCAYLFAIPSSHPSFHPLSLHDALPIWPAPEHPDRGGGAHPRGLLHGLPGGARVHGAHGGRGPPARLHRDAVRPAAPHPDRKSTRLNSSHVKISYAVFCLKKKTQKQMSS